MHGRETTPFDPARAMIPAGSRWARLPMIGAIVGGLGLVASIGLGMAQPKQFFFSWLFSFLFALSIALGAIYFVLITWAVQAGWGIVVRRIAENVMSVVPFLALLFVPILVGLTTLYPWSVPGAAANDALLRWKSPFLNVPFFVARAVFYFAVWTVVALVWSRLSRIQDTTGNPKLSATLRRFAGPAVIAVGLTQTFASFDWIMTLEPHWYSTIFGVYFFAGSVLAFLCLLTLISASLEAGGPLRGVVTSEHFHDVGKLIFAFTCFWAYIGFSQFFLIWYGNLPEETIWFKIRLEGSWKAVSLLLAVGHFIVPFFFLMGRTVKRRRLPLMIGAWWMLVMHLLDLYWQVSPMMHPEGFRPSILDLTCLAAILGLCMAVVGRIMVGRALVPIKDPRLAESLSFENV